MTRCCKIRAGRNVIYLSARVLLTKLRSVRGLRRAVGIDTASVGLALRLQRDSAILVGIGLTGWVLTRFVSRRPRKSPRDATVGSAPTTSGKSDLRARHDGPSGSVTRRASRSPRPG